MELSFRKISDFPRGTLYRLLVDAYSFDTCYRQYWEQEWLQFDKFFFDNLDIADKYGFITEIGEEAIGLISWDPRQRPDYVEIGHNCIITKYKGNGYGKQQLSEAVKRIKTYENLRKIIVETNSNLIAPRNYESVGFQLVHRRENHTGSAFSGDYLEYEILI